MLYLEHSWQIHKVRIYRHTCLNPYPRLRPGSRRAGSLLCTGVLQLFPTCHCTSLPASGGQPSATSCRHGSRSLHSDTAVSVRTRSSRGESYSATVPYSAASGYRASEPVRAACPNSGFRNRNAIAGAHGGLAPIEDGLGGGCRRDSSCTGSVPTCPGAGWRFRHHRDAGQPAGTFR